VHDDWRIGGQNAHADAWVALSEDSGAAWKEYRVSEESSDFFNGFFGGPPFIGD
jgi:hypothetical protein